MVFLVCNQNLRLACAILENSWTQICFNQSEGTNQWRVGRSLKLNEDQDEALRGLAVGAIAGWCPKPVKVRVDHFPLHKDVTNEEVARHVQPLLTGLAACRNTG